LGRGQAAACTREGIEAPRIDAEQHVTLLDPLVVLDLPGNDVPATSGAIPTT
jgi:hypothetical protein